MADKVWFGVATIKLIELPGKKIIDYCLDNQ
jgi:hypothetical protein